MQLSLSMFQNTLQNQSNSKLWVGVQLISKLALEWYSYKYANNIFQYVLTTAYLCGDTVVYLKRWSLLGYN